MLVATIDKFSKPWEGYIPTVMYYDSRGNMIQKRSRPPYGLQVEFYDYNFTGQPTKHKVVYYNNDAIKYNEENYAYTYDHAGRLKKTTHKLNQKPEVVLAINTYDDLGRLKSTKSVDNSNLKVDYSYNIRSWTKGITSPLFTQTLNYQESDEYYNGNVSSISWSNVDNIIWNRYSFKYDQLSQLSDARYTNLTKDDNVYIKGNPSHDESFEYDKHGNVSSLSRDNGVIMITKPSVEFRNRQIDNLTISYNGNQLKKIIDNSFLTEGFKDYDEERDLRDVEYSYNRNGAMTWDANKGVSTIYDLYNGMPKTTSVNNSIAQGLNIYGYTASGTKLFVAQYYDPTKTIQPMSGTAFQLEDFNKNDEFQGATKRKQTFYEGRMIHEDWTVKKILLDNGYYDFTDNKYYFYVRDHLGNNRVVADASGNVVQRNDYYPFGMPFNEQTVDQDVQPYKFGGKEYDTMHGLDQYDFHSRQYDPAISRFNTVDPLAEKKPWLTPYHYCSNNPINRVDPTGMTDYYNEKAKLVKADKDGSTNRMLVFTRSNKEADVNSAITSGSLMDVPSNEVVSTMEKAFDKTETSGNENGFRVGEKGTVSVMVEGSQGEINASDWKPAVDDIRNKGDRVAYDVHTHPNTKDSEGNVIHRGRPEPSPTDKANIVGSQPNIVLGYREQPGIRPSGMIGGTVPNTYVRQIGFFRSSGEVTSPKDFSNFKSTISKINKIK